MAVPATLPLTVLAADIRRRADEYTDPERCAISAAFRRTYRRFTDVWVTPSVVHVYTKDGSYKYNLPEAEERRVQAACSELRMGGHPEAGAKPWDGRDIPMVLTLAA